jgi:hypothetical protein
VLGAASLTPKGHERAEVICAAQQAANESQQTTHFGTHDTSNLLYGLSASVCIARCAETPFSSFRWRAEAAPADALKRLPTAAIGAKRIRSTKTARRTTTC